MSYAELHCHSYYSFHDGASSLEELLTRSKELGYAALAVTDHDNLCGAMRYAHLSKSLDFPGIIGAEITVKGGYHLTFLAENREGYRNLCRLITAAHEAPDRLNPELPPEIIGEHASGLICLSGCPKGELAQLVESGKLDEARHLIRQYLGWFGSDNYFIELQNNLVYGDRARNKTLVALARECGASIVATGNVHYHVRERHRMQDCLASVKACQSLEGSHRERRPNSEFYLRPVAEIEALFEGCPDALANTVKIAGRCHFDLTQDSGYTFPDYPVPEGQTPDSYLESLCFDAAVRRYGAVTPEVRTRLDEEFRLIKKHKLAGFLLLYRDVITLGRDAMIDQGLVRPVADFGREPARPWPRLLGGPLDRLPHWPVAHRPPQIQAVAGAFPAGGRLGLRAGH